VSQFAEIVSGNRSKEHRIAGYRNAIPSAGLILLSGWPGAPLGAAPGLTAPARHRRISRVVHAQKAWLCMHNG